MSQWAHINGVFRIRYPVSERFNSKGLSRIQNRNYVRIKRIFGPQSDDVTDAESGKRLWEEITVPKGSEGSIHWRMSSLERVYPDFPPTEDSGYLYKGFFVAFGGDLRDVGPDKLQEIIDWFEGTCKKMTKFFMIRQGSCEIMFDSGDRCILTTEMDYFCPDKHKIYAVKITGDENNAY